ncbi:MAG: hypothetical protein H6611_04375 [Ignavibacteriales bacterium]|nr:hypothetical protein [Ignavibacteriales bacterium]MCB9209629.1 hypothetical protein [Ignavibacteriales bacterium]
MDVKDNRKKIPNSKEIVTKGIYENGEIKLRGKKLPKKKMNVIVSFREEKNEKSKSKDKAASNFIKKWSGVINANDVELVMEKKLEYLIEKHK